MSIVLKFKNSVFSKLLATVMSGLLTVGQVGAVSQGLTQRTAHEATASSKKITKKQALAIGGGVVGVIVIIGGVIYRLSCFGNDGSDGICDKAQLYNPKRKVSAEEWFTRLGGARADVDEYVSQNNNIENQILNNSDKKIKEQFKQIDKDIDRTFFKDTDNITQGNRHELLRKILKASILKNDLNQGSKGYIQGFSDTCAMVICKFLGESMKCDLATEAKIYYVYNALVNNKFILWDDSTKDMTDVMDESLKCKCFNECGKYKALVRNDIDKSYVPCMIARWWTAFGARLFNDLDHIRIIHVWDRIITDDSVYISGAFDHKRAFVKLLTVINLFYAKYIDEFCSSYEGYAFWVEYSKYVSEQLKNQLD